MNNHTLITDNNDPRITPEDRALAKRLHSDEPSTSWAACEIANHRRTSICRAAGIAENDPTSLEALVWYWNDRGQYEGQAKTWKDYAEELEKEIETYEEVHEDHQRIVREIDVIINGEEGAAKQSSLCDLVEDIRQMATDITSIREILEQRTQRERELEQLNLELARLEAEERGVVPDPVTS